MNDLLGRVTTPFAGWVRRNPYRLAVWVLVGLNLTLAVDMVMFLLRPDLYRMGVPVSGEIDLPPPDAGGEPGAVRERTPTPGPLPDRFRRLFVGSVFGAADSGGDGQVSPGRPDRARTESRDGSPGKTGPGNLKLDVIGWVSDTTSVRVLVRDRSHNRSFTLEPGDTVPGHEFRLESTGETRALFRRSDGVVVEDTLPAAKPVQEGEIQRTRR